MSQFLESFFDDNSSNFKLWSKESDHINMSQEEVLYANSLYKMSSKSNKWKPRHFVLTRNYLVYFKSANDKKIKGHISLNWVRNEYLMEPNQSKEFSFGIKFIKNMKYSELWAGSEEIFKAWKEALAKVCIQSDFHIKYTAIKMIGKGSFARVRDSQ
jgi:hypothetical protein